MKKVTVALLLLVAVVGGYFAYNIISPKPMPKPSPSATREANSSITFTLEQISEHKDQTSCWLAIDGQVYDVTPFVASGFHPGKDAILQGCGKDATELFNTRPMGSKTSHSERARKMLPKYLIGELEK